MSIENLNFPKTPSFHVSPLKDSILQKMETLPQNPIVVEPLLQNSITT